MANHLAALEAQEEEDDEIFVYMGGNQEVPQRVRRARIHQSVKFVRARAFYHRRHLNSVEFHDGLEIVEEYAFENCVSLRSLKLLGIRIIKAHAFYWCTDLTDVEFGNKLETIEKNAFDNCRSLRGITMPFVRNIEYKAFYSCYQLTELNLPEGLETVEESAFNNCQRLTRIILPLKDDMVEDSAFYGCCLIEVTLAGGIHKTVDSLHMESWRNEMKGEINRINQTLLYTDHWEKTQKVQHWMGSVTRRLDLYKTEHQKILKEATTLLELALWKANLDENEGCVETEGARTTRGQRKRARREICVTSGASIVIKNVLPYLELK